METEILDELHRMSEKVEFGFAAMNQRLDGVGLRFDIVDERFFKLKGQVDDYMDLTVQNTLAIYELQDALNIKGMRGMDSADMIKR